MKRRGIAFLKASAWYLAALALWLGLLLSASGQWFAYRTHFTHHPATYTPPGSLAHHLWTNWTARTNGRTPALLASVTSTSATWNTNWFFYGASNFTAQTIHRTNTVDHYSRFRCTVISPVLLLQCAHAFNLAAGTSGTNLGVGQWFSVLDPTNGLHWRRVAHSLGRRVTDDYILFAITNPLPAEVGAMRVAHYQTVTNKLGFPFGFGPQVPITSLCQHYLNIGALGFYLDGHGVEDGDSGSPTVLLIGDELVSVPWGFTSASVSNLTQFLADVNTLTTLAGFSTNTYPVRIANLSEWNPPTP